MRSTAASITSLLCGSNFLSFFNTASSERIVFLEYVRSRPKNTHQLVAAGAVIREQHLETFAVVRGIFPDRPGIPNMLHLLPAVTAKVGRDLQRPQGIEKVNIVGFGFHGKPPSWKCCIR